MAEQKVLMGKKDDCLHVRDVTWDHWIKDPPGWWQPSIKSTIFNFGEPIGREDGHFLASTQIGVKLGQATFFSIGKKRWVTPFRFRECRCPIVVGLGDKKNPEILAEIFNQEVERTNSFFLKHAFKKWSYEKTRLATFLSSFINFNFSLFAPSVAATLFVLRLSKPKPNNISELSGNEKFFFVRISFVFFPIGKPISQTSNEKKILNDLLQREKMLSFYWWHILLIQAHLYLRQQCYGSLFLDSILFPKPLWVTLDQFEKQVMVEIKLGSLGHEATSQTSRPPPGHGPLRPTCHKEYHQAF